MSRMGELERALEACLAAIRSGQDPRVVLSQHPELHAELEPLLQVATELRSASPAAPTPEFRAAARARLMARARASNTAQPAGLRRWLSWPAPAPRWASSAAATLVALGLAGTLTVGASASALPGDALYPVKRLGEDVQLSLAQNDEAKLRLRLRLLDERLKEALSLTVRGEAARANEAASAYAETLEQLDAAAAREPEAPSASEFLERLEEHQQRLTQVLERAPEPAQPALQHALERSSRGLERAAAVHAEKAAADEQPATVDTPARTEEARPTDSPDFRVRGTEEPGNRGGRNRDTEERGKDARESEGRGRAEDKAGGALPREAEPKAPESKGRRGEDPAPGAAPPRQEGASKQDDERPAIAPPKPPPAHKGRSEDRRAERQQEEIPVEAGSEETRGEQDEDTPPPAPAPAPVQRQREARPQSNAPRAKDRAERGPARADERGRDDASGGRGKR